MGNDGSVPARLLPAVLSLAAVGVGALAMRLAFALLYAPAGLRLALVGAELALIAPAVVVLALGPVAWRRDVGARALPARTVGLCLAAGLSFWVGSAGILELQPAFWSPPPGYLEAFRQIHAALRPSGPIDAVFSVLAIALVPAACEELLFRGVVLPSVLRLAGPWWAVGASAVLFAAVHLPDWYRFPFALTVGVGLGLLRLFTGSLLACFLAHGLLNAVTFVVAPFLDDPTEVVPEPHLLLGLALLTVGGLGAVAILRALRRGGGPGHRPEGGKGRRSAG